MNRKTPQTKSFCALVWLLSLLAPLAGIAAAEEGATVLPAEDSRVPLDTKGAIFERVTIVGNADRDADLPGSAHAISRATLEEQGHTDIQRILREIPGLAIQEEDGLGLRPNIGLRGTGVERSQKITLLEDGVLIAPAPYTAPAAYYFPTAARMESIEVRKGSVAIAHGPYTTGGAINLLSRSVPGRFSGSVQVIAGQHDTLRSEAYVGNGGERFGWLLDLLHNKSSGFKQLDGPLSDTGTTLNDALAKLRASASGTADLQQQFEVKLGRTTQLGHETYLGLTRDDFALNPYRRYASSALDTIDAVHGQLQGRYFLQPTSSLDLMITAYRNDFARDWFKNESVLGVSNALVLANPERYGSELAILRGDSDGPDDALTLRHNNREYLSQGIQSLLTWSPSSNSPTGPQQEWQFGFRVHQDHEDRLQNDEGFRIQNLTLERTSVGNLGSQSNRLSKAQAVSGYLQNTLRIDRWTVRAGLRFEGIDYQRQDFSKQDPTRSLGPTRTRDNNVDVVIPGIGISYALNDRQHLFLGAHRGFSPPGAGVNEDTKEERSTSFEFGYRRTARRWSGDAVLFASNYSNLLGAETLSGGGQGLGELFNGGKVSVRGAELSTRTVLARRGNWSLPFRAAYTYTQAEFDSSFETSFTDWAPRVQAGDHLPYLPRHQAYSSFGLNGAQFSLFLTASWTSKTRSNAGQGPITNAESIDARMLVDATARWRFTDRWSAFVETRNLFDANYLAARRPYGLRPGLGRTVSFGFDLDF